MGLLFSRPSYVFWGTFLVLSLFSIVVSAEGKWDPQRTEVSEFLDRKRAGEDVTFNREVENSLYDYVFLMTHGFMGEWNPCSDQIAFVGSRRYHRRTDAHFRTIHPSSQLSLEQNAENVADGYRKVLERTPSTLKPVVLAHSMGGPIVLKALIDNPELLTRLHAIYVFQGAFGGTPIADHHVGVEHTTKTDKEMGFWTRAFFEIGTIFNRFLVRRYDKTVTALTTREMVPFMRRLLEKAKKTRVWDPMVNKECSLWEVLDRRLYYVVTVDKLGATQWLRAPHAFLETYYGPSDGLILLRDQYPNKEILPELSNGETLEPPLIVDTSEGFEKIPAPLLGKIMLLQDGVDHRDFIVDHWPLVDSTRGLRRAVWHDLLKHLKMSSK